MKLIYSLIFALYFTTTFAQTPNAFVRSYGNNDFNYGKGIIALPDTSYIIAGNRNFNGSIGSIWLFRVDSIGQIIWETYVNHYEAAIVEDIAWFNDTSFIICGTVLQDFDYQFYVAKYSINGNKIWENTFGTPAWDYGKALVFDSTDIWLTGYSFPYDTSNTDAVICKINSNTGDSLLYHRVDVAHSDMGTYIDTMSNFLVLSTVNTDINNDSTYSTVFMFRKDLTPEWSFHFGNDSTNFKMMCSIQDAYGRLVIGGGLEHRNDTIDKKFYYLGVLYLDGTFVYDKTGNEWGSQVLKRMIPTNTSIYYGVGSNHTEGLNNGNSDFGLMWDNLGYSGSYVMGALQNDYGEDIALSADSGIVMIGSSESYGANAMNILLIKTNKAFVYNDNDYVHYTAIEKTENNRSAIAFPNPSTGVFSFSQNIQYSKFTVTDLYGRTLTSGNVLINHSIDLSEYPSGIYFISFYNSKTIQTIQLFLQK